MVKDKIKSLRKENNLTQQDLAESIFVSRQTISRWESGLSIPTTENIAQIAKLFEKDTSYFFPDSYFENKIDTKNETFSEKLKIFVNTYWRDIIIFTLALTPLLHILFTPLSAYSYIYARKKKKNYSTIIGLIVFTFSIFFFIQLIILIISIFGLAGSTTEIIME